MGASTSSSARYSAIELVTLATRLLACAGMATDRAADVATVLVEGDCLGKATHGLALLPLYLREIESGGMALNGEPEVINDTGVCLTWDGRKLPGPWLVRQAVSAAMARTRKFGNGIVVIQRSHHTACLGAYLRQATDAGYMMLLTLTDPGHSSVAPYGGMTPVLTSNPIAFGAPAPNGPILIDMSTALMTNGAAAYRRRGELLPHPFLIDNQGQPSTDPAVMATTPPGSILPLGGMEAGHKGFSLGLMVELLTGCLSGRGRADANDGWSAVVFLLVVDPAAFGGAEACARQVEALARACREAASRPGFDHIALPGENALEHERLQRREGVILSREVIKSLEQSAAQFGIQMPDSIH
jgi:LDH2 family malate/lactate/ureidoglycolate dehydrogenase